MSTRVTSTLAIHGGRPIRDVDRPWPTWPVPNSEAKENLHRVLAEGPWTLSGPKGDRDLYERRFAQQFAAYNGTAHCVPVDHGSSALVVALEALGLDHGDRVLVPTLTWTASATAAFRAGLVPVLTDVDATTGSMSPADIDLTVGARAAIVVHWSCAMADVPAILSTARPKGIAVIEDCAQSHGAEWLGRRAGSMGRLGCFSMQHGKVLTCGEGGAVVTNDAALALLLEELRADSRRYRTDSTPRGELEVAEIGSTLGSNFCMSEFHAAVLCAELLLLDQQHETRARNYAILAELLCDIPGVRLLRPPSQQTRMSIYELPIVFDVLPPGMTAADVAAALTAELGKSFYLTDAPLHRSPLLRPWNKPSLAPLTRAFLEHHEGRSFPNSDFYFEHSVVTHHSTLLGDERDMADIAAAITKVTASRD